ncbi:MAG: 2-amino-4-hydroxy-6-hydroxymethyldihydropteridine diphosphokinase [Acidobacteriia bacterium]|nr:2-amino-4-hydroxy-6-hydroxymethyldihydropteridine diphosphokinase [Terriglobia bacterium]
MKVRAFIAVGSNIRPEENVRTALLALARQEQIVAVSTIYRTEPEGRPDQPDFYNCVVEIKTDKTPEALKYQVLRRIEAGLGRQRTSDKFAPRTIDLDLMLYDDLVLDTDSLVLPDPEIASRAFLAACLSELAPDMTLPGTTSWVTELAARLPQDHMHPLEDYTAQIRRDMYFLGRG